MKKIKSKYKVFGGFGILVLLNGIAGVNVYRLLTTSNSVDLWRDRDAQIEYAIIFGLQFLFLFLLATRNRFIIADSSGVTFINPLLPFLKKTTKWTDFDYYMTVSRDTEYPTDESVWLVKNRKLAARFSSFDYSNYQDLKSQILTKKRTARDFNSFEHIFILLGIGKIED